MYLNISYEQEFNDLMLYLKEKYPKELFDLDGIGKQLDLSKFSKDFFGKSIKTTTDKSIDQNSNVDDISVISYTNELKKPFETETECMNYIEKNSWEERTKQFEKILYTCFSHNTRRSKNHEKRKNVTISKKQRQYFKSITINSKQGYGNY